MMKWCSNIKYNVYKKKLVWDGRKKSRITRIEPMKEPIDFVVTWVDGKDPEWLSIKGQYEKKYGMKIENAGNGEERYRDWDIFQYWFRAVEKYAPWVRYVYLVTCGQTPTWINTNAPKLKIINHTDFIPHQYLPTFSSNPIELNLHRIKGLSEYFVYFNDDVFLNRPVCPEDFFRGGKPNYTAVVRPLKNITNGAFEHMQFSTMSVINSYFGEEISQRIQDFPEKWFSEKYGRYYIDWNLHAFDKNYLPGIVFPHLAVAYKKSIMEKAWNIAPEMLHETSLHRLRTPKDIIHQVFSIWAMLEGDFNAVSKEHHGKVFSAQVKDKEEIVDAIINEKYRMICINDSEQLSQSEYLVLKDIVKGAFEKKFLEKSQYEKA
ncbi:Stealth CR1 domain-containing protein [Dorea sp. YH-dor228]|uniref:Stealth CR1 domain-containing protein n=1 Tax=Dorea sp. YH-dor228 TaxID=3151120 RepID=UPI003242A032